MGIVLSLDVGLSTGCALLCEPLIATDTVAADDLRDYLRAVRDLLSMQGLPIDVVVAERPLTIFRSALSRDLDALCGVVNSIFPTVHWIEAPQWKGQQQPLTAYARSRHLVAWRRTRTRHERDALLIGLWHQGVLAPVKSP